MLTRSNLKYAAVSAWVEERALKPLTFEVVSEPPYINDVGETFKANFERLTALANAPIGFTSVAMKMQLGLDTARLTLFSRIDATADDDAPAVRDRILEETNRVLPTLRRRPAPGMTNAQTDACRVDSIIEQLDVARDAVSAIYSGLLLNAWTTFESLAGDLWVAALDSHAAGLSKMSGGKKRISALSAQKRGKKGEVATQETISEREKQISLSDIHKITRGDFNLSNKMGTLLREKYEFDSLEKIRQAYSLAFVEHSQDLDEVLADPRLDALCAVRNLIVHSGGYATQEYLERMKSVPGIPVLALKQRIDLHGESIVNLIDPVITLGCELLTKVTRWIKAELK